VRSANINIDVDSKTTLGRAFEKAPMEAAATICISLLVE